MTDTESGLGGPERDYGEEALVMSMGGGIITLDAATIETSLLERLREGRIRFQPGVASVYLRI